MRWADKDNGALAHSIRISYTEGIEYQNYRNDKIVNNSLKKLTIDQIGEGKFETLLREITYLPDCLKNAHQFVKKIKVWLMKKKISSFVIVKFILYSN